MTYRVLHAGDAVWRPSTRKGVPNTDLAGQLGAATLSAADLAFMYPDGPDAMPPELGG